MSPSKCLTSHKLIVTFSSSPLSHVAILACVLIGRTNIVCVFPSSFGRKSWSKGGTFRSMECVASLSDSSSERSRTLGQWKVPIPRDNMPMHTIGNLGIVRLGS